MAPPASDIISLRSLHERLTSASTSAETFTYLLNTHKDALFEAIVHPSAQEGEGSNVTYLFPCAATKRFPQPTPAEEALIQSLQSHLTQSRNVAANLVRDFLRFQADPSLEQLLVNTPDLAFVAPLHAITNFWRSERRAAFATVAAVLYVAARSSNHLLHDAAANFLAENLSTIRARIVDAADAVLDSFDDTTTAAHVSVAAHQVQPCWCMELLFAFTLSTSLSLSERENLFSSYCRLSTSHNRFATPAPSNTIRLSPSALDGGPTSILFVLAVNRSNGLNDLVNDLMKEPKRRDLLDASAVQNLENIYSSLRSDPSPETVLLSLSWSTYLRLRHHQSPEATELFPNMYITADAHMRFAMSFGALDLLHEYAQTKLPIETNLFAEVAKTIWTELSAFLTAFPPNTVFANQVDNLLSLATNILKGVRRADVSSIAQLVWRAEGTDEQFAGPNALLRAAAGVFPQDFLPLVRYLTVLVVDAESAHFAGEFLSHLCSATELIADYQDLVHVLGEEDGDIRDYLEAQGQDDYQDALEAIHMIRQGEGDPFYVQAMDNILEAGYRPSIPKGSIGFSSPSSATITWIIPWNGFGAVTRILHVLLDLLLDQQKAQSYEDAILEELSQSASESCRLIYRVCSEGNANSIDNLFDSSDLSSILAAMVIELADPGDRAKASWLTKVRQETLLTAASASLASLTASNTSKAQFALERIDASRNTYPFSMALNNLGDGAFPAVSALGCIAISCSRGAFLSQDKNFILSSLSAINNREYPGGLERRETSTASVVGFFTDVVLPLWLTSTSRNTHDQIQVGSPYWLMPASSLELFSWNPNVVLYSPVVSSLFASVVTASCESGSRDGPSGFDMFLFPALRSALTACYIALRERNKNLQEGVRDVSGKRTATTVDLNGISEPTPFEVTLQKPTVVHAMASLSSGSAPIFDSTEFFEAWRHSKYCMFSPKPDSSRLWLMYPQANASELDSSSAWRSWLITMSARCLSLQFCCLSHVSEHSDVIQVPWPTLHKSSFGNWRGGGDLVRMGYANLIESSDPVPVLELLVSILACGQRAASRSLMAPRVPSSFSERNNARNTTDRNRESDGESKTEETCEIMAAVVGCLRNHLTKWLNVTGSPSIETEESGESMAVLESLSISIASCIRFLRVAKESHSSRWFMASWDELDVWTLFADVLQCEGTSLKSAGPSHFERALKCRNSSSIVSEFFENSGSSTKDLQELVSQVPTSVDIPTVWKAAAADVLQVFTSQIVLKTTEGLLAMQAEDPDSSQDETKDKLPNSVFQDAPFTAFQSAFSEKWLPILFSPNEGDSSDKITSVSTPPGLDGDPLMRGTLSDSGEHTRASAEEIALRLSSSLAKLFNTSNGDVGFEILQRFQRTGDIGMEFGADYFDVLRLTSFLEMFSLQKQQVIELIHDVVQLNHALTRQDVQVGVVRAFSNITSAVNFADSLCGSAGSRLTYSSAQFGGKVCRFLCHVLVNLAPTVGVSSHCAVIALEISKLIASLSSQLSPDELEQPALTAVKTHTIPISKELRSLSPVGQICFFINEVLQTIEPISETSDTDRLEVIKWLFLTAAKLSQGPAFGTNVDLQSLATTALSTLRVVKGVPHVLSAAAVTLSTLLQYKRIPMTSVFDLKGIQTIFWAIAALADVHSDDAEREKATEIASVLLLVVAHGYTNRTHSEKEIQSFILRQLSGGIVQTYLPQSADVVTVYDITREKRNMTHLFWCSCLQLASVVIPHCMDQRGSLRENERERADILEFCCANLARLSRDSLDLTGNWASGYIANSCGVGNLLTIGRLEEAELAAAVMFPLAGRALHVKANLPDILRSTIAQLVHYVENATRLIRAEPVERWVRPISERERERSVWLYNDNNASTNQVVSGSTPLWGMSPIKSTAPRSPTPPRRSPSQAVRAAVGDGRNSPIPQSPGFTPLQTNSNTGLRPSHLSPLSKWGPHGAGIITESGVSFGEEVSRSLLRGLTSALGALRRFSIELDEPLFSTSTSTAEEAPGLGLLQSILHHAGGELQRGADSERREQFLSIAENVLLLIVRHVKIYVELEALTQGAKDEIRKRSSLYVQRMRRIVPPPPSTSIVHSEELDSFWKQI